MPEETLLSFEVYTSDPGTHPSAVLPEEDLVGRFDCSLADVLSTGRRRLWLESGANGGEEKGSCFRCKGINEL